MMCSHSGNNHWNIPRVLANGTCPLKRWCSCFGIRTYLVFIIVAVYIIIAKLPHSVLNRQDKLVCPPAFKSPLFSTWGVVSLVKKFNVRF